MDIEQQVLAFRKAFSELDEDTRYKEVLRAHRIVTNTPVIVLEDDDIGKVLKFLDVANLIEYFWTAKRIRADRSYIYKVLRGQHKEAYGFKIYYEYEEEER